MKHSTKRKKASGLLLHITSLPSNYGIGDLGPEAYKFADFLSKAKQSLWQVLPLNPPSSKSGNSPYNCDSAFAGNSLLISPELLFRQGLLTKKEISAKVISKTSSVNFKLACRHKQKLFEIAYRRFKTISDQDKFNRYCLDNDYWLSDYALFSAFCKQFKGKVWCHWPKKIRDRDSTAIEIKKSELAELIEYEKFLQYLFFKQWNELKEYCNNLNIEIIGDVPIYIAFDSADVWSHPEYFKLTKSKKQKFISGVPPDLFSSQGQLWNNPVYNWITLKKDSFEWWLKRIRHNLDMCDIVRIDHFRGFVAFWQLHAGVKNAVNGKWIKGPGDAFFKALFKHVDPNKIIAEDLGYITSSVRKYIKNYALTGMRVLQFGFENDFLNSPHFTENHINNCIAYTGTHDNNTIKGWFEKEIKEQMKERLFDYFGRKVPLNKMHEKLIEILMNSAADRVVIPVQDILGLGSLARMNHPGKIRGNWRWRLKSGQLNSEHASKLSSLTCKYNRS
ncbi:MAG: 4-alpha-glucanotransferase [Planctomycetota bacterium]